MGILNHVGYGWLTSAYVVATIVSDKQVDVPLVVVGGNPLVNACGFPIPVEVQNDGQFLAC